MKEFELKYGCNPNQKPAKIYMADGSDLPVTILNGRPGYQFPGRPDLLSAGQGVEDRHRPSLRHFL